jgi:hypothetical protein
MELEADISQLKLHCDQRDYDRLNHEEKSLQQRRDQESAFQIALEDVLLENNRLHAKAVADIEETHQGAIAEIQRKLELLQEAHNKAMVDADVEFHQERELKFAALQAEALHSIQKADDLARDRHNAALVCLISRHGVELGAVNRELEDTRAVLHTAATEYQAVSMSLVELEETFEAKLCSGLLELTSEVNLLRDVLVERDAAVAEAQTTIMELEDAQMRREVSIQVLKKERDEASDQVEASGARVLSALKEELSQLKEDLRDKSLALREALKQEDKNLELERRVRNLLGEIEHERESKLSLKERQEVSLLEVRADSEARMRDVMAAHEVEVKALVDEKIQSFRKMNELESRMSSVVADVENRYASEMARMKEEYGKELAASSQREVVIKLQAEQRQAELESLYEHTQVVEELQTKHDTLLLAVKEENDNLLAQLKEELVKEYETRVHELEESFSGKERAMQAMMEQYSLDKSLSDERYEKVISEYQHNEAQRHMSGITAQTELNDREESLQVSHRETLQELTQQHEAALRDLKESAQRNMGVRLLEMEAEHNERIQCLELDLASKSQELLIVLGQNEGDREHFDEQLQEVTNEYQQLLLDARVEMEQVRAELAEASARAEEERSQLVELREREIEELISSHTTQVTAVMDAHALERQALIAKHEEELTAATKQGADALARLEDVYVFDTRQLSDQLEVAMLGKQDLAQTLERIDREYKEDLLRYKRQFESELSAERERSQKEFEELRDSNEQDMASLRAVQSEVLETVSTQYKAELSVEEMQHLQTIEVKLREQEVRLNLSMRDLSEDFSETKRCHVEELRALRESLEADFTAEIRLLEVNSQREILVLSEELRLLNELTARQSAELEDILEKHAMVEAALNERLSSAELAKMEALERASALKCDLELLRISSNSTEEHIAMMETKSIENSQAEMAERDSLLEIHRRAVQGAMEEANARLLESEREHIVKLEAVHTQLGEVEARHFARVERLEMNLMSQMAEKQELFEALQTKDVSLQQALRQVEKIRREADDMLKNVLVEGAELLKVSAEADRANIENQYRQEISTLLENNTDLKLKLEATGKHVRILEAEMQGLQVELKSVTVEKGVLVDVYTKLVDGKYNESLVSEIKSGISAAIKENLTTATIVSLPLAKGKDYFVYPV